MNGSWDLGLVPCLLWTGCDVFLSTTSIMHLCAIALHRFLGISYPLHFRSQQEFRHVVALITPTWLISFAISLPLIIQGTAHTEHVLITRKDNKHQCGIFDNVFAIYSSMVSFFIPLVIMVIADIRSVQILRKSQVISTMNGQYSSSLPISRSQSRSTTTSKDTSVYDLGNGEKDLQATSPLCEVRPNTTTSSTLAKPSNHDNTSRSSTEHVPALKVTHHRERSKSMGYIGMLSTRGMIKVNSRERRAERTLIWVFVVFVVLWLPFFCTNLTYGLCTNCSIPPRLFQAFTWLGYISSGVNPCIYTLLNKDFRNAFKRIILCRWCRPNLSRTFTG